MKYFITLSLISISFSMAMAQGSTPVPEYSLTTHILDRLTIKTNGEQGVSASSIKPYWRKDAASLSESDNETLMSVLTEGDEKDLEYMAKDNTEYAEEAIESRKPILRYFYRTPAHFFHHRSKYLKLSVDPIVHFAAGYEKRGEGGIIFDNRRGIDLRASVDDRVYLQASVVETQTKFPSWVMDKVISDGYVVPYAGYVKPYNSRFSDVELDGWDYLIAQGLVGVNISKHVGVQFGHGRNFIGDGYRSLLLGDRHPPYFYLKFNTRVWRLHYQNIFAELTYDNAFTGDRLLPKKYMAAHYLDFKVAKGLNLGLFESVIFARENHFEFQYLNPLVLYRSVEHAIGSPDNVTLGFNGHYNFLNRFSLYTQFVLDDINFGESKNGSGWWGNKYGYQIGLKYIDMFGVDHLDGQLEFNTVRPYTYSDNDTTSVYSHYNQPLAHPLGANFREIMFQLRYQPIQPLTVTLRMLYVTQGLDSLGSNWGSNIFMPNDIREQDYNNSVGQGIKTTITTADLQVSYMFRHNMFADLRLMYRKQDHEVAVNSPAVYNSLYFGVALRVNIADRDFY